MEFAFVMDDLSVRNNGTSVTALRFAEALRDQGHGVRLVGFGVEGPQSFPVPERHIPIVRPVAAMNGFRFAQPVPEVLDGALSGVDLIHCFLPFQLERHALAWGRAHGVPVSAAFHLQPENVTYNAGVGPAPALCDAIYDRFSRWLYGSVRHIHCPSEMIARQLARHGYTAELSVISNGVPPDFSPVGPVARLEEGLIHVVTVGRLAPEKNQATIIEAVARSRHAGRIRLHICGRGPERRRLLALGRKLPVEPRIGFHDAAELQALERACPLYVHASVADIEAISVIEAFACGCIPIIGQAEMSAPSAFALCGQSLFPATDADALAARLDWWIDHPEAQEQWRPRYRAEAESLSLDRCVGRFVDMAEAAVADDLAAYGAGETGGGGRP